MKELILVRHAKSDWPSGIADLDRPLSERGKKDCLAAAELLAKVENLSEYEVHVSIAKRTVDTWSLIASNLTKELPVVLTDAIYEASLGELFDYLQSQEGEKLVFVGHNPGLALLGSFLTGERMHKFPTLSIWHISTSNDWIPETAKTVLRDAPRADRSNLDSD